MRIEKCKQFHTDGFVSDKLLHTKTGVGDLASIKDIVRIVFKI